MADSKTTKAELAEAVRELREEVARLRAERHTWHGHALCHSHIHCNWGHCGCFTVHSSYYPLPGCAPYQLPQVWYGTVTTTNVASGCNPNPVLGHAMSGD